MQKKKYLLLFITILNILGCLGMTPGFGVEQTSEILASIEFSGLQNTQKEYALDILGLKVGETYNTERVQKALQRLKNTGFFQWVVAIPQHSPKGMVLQIQCKEKWTLIPIVALKGGGGTVVYTLGARESHLGGRGINLGMRVSLLDGVASPALWFYVPSLLSSPFHIKAEGSQDYSRTLLYNPTDGTRSIGTWEQKNKQGQLQFIYDKSPLEKGYALGLGGGIKRTDLEEAQNLPSAFTQNNSTQNHAFATALVQWHYKDNNGLQNRGFNLLLNVKPHWPLNPESASFIKSEAVFNGEYSLTKSTSLNANVFLGLSSHTSKEPWSAGFFSVGGFTEIRGFFDGQFSGNAVAYANTEIRTQMPLPGISLFMLEIAGFVDGGVVQHPLKTQTPLSVGVGLRLPVVFMYQVVPRMDIAFPLHPTLGKMAYLSYGFTEFF